MTDPTNDFSHPATKVADCMAVVSCLPGVNPPYPAYIRPLDLLFEQPGVYWYRAYSRHAGSRLWSVSHKFDRAL